MESLKTIKDSEKASLLFLKATEKRRKTMKIFSFDIGIASIGWAYIEDDALKDCGVRIFTKAENPKNGDSLAAPRREARGARRRLARRKARLYALKKLICKEFGLKLGDYLAPDGELPKAYCIQKCKVSKDERKQKRQTEKGKQELEKLNNNPYRLRKEGLERKLNIDELARVILHIAKHRGYGNKHAKDADDSESGKVKKAIKENEKLLLEKGYQSAGQYLYNEFFEKPRDFDIEQKSAKNTYGTQEFKNVRNKAESYARCLNQSELQKELGLIFAKQREFGFNFSDTKYQIIDENGKLKELNFESAIMEIAFLQRPLKSFEDKIGKCTFYVDEPRAPKDSLSAMEFVALTRIINILANITKRSGEVYSADKLHEILDVVLEKGEISYKKLRKIINLDERIQFPKDSKLDYAKKDAENAKVIEFKKLKSFSKAFGDKGFKGLTRNELDKIANDIALTKSKAELKDKLKHYPNLNEEQNKKQIENLSELNFDKFIDLSFRALEQILPFMRKGLRYDEAIKEAGLKEHKKSTEKTESLPPIKDYEPYLANPVVARALSEYRKVCNALLKKYGKVHKIHLEFTREAGKSYDERKKIEKEQREHFEANQNAQKQCEILGLPLNGANILKMKLWIEQGEYCVYSGEKITPEHLKDSTMLQIDHIYPYSRSFDDSQNNKVLVFAKENQNKLDKTPFEAFGADKEKWDKILSRASKLPTPKYRRISNTQFTDKEAGFLARNLNDTSYIARLASQWTKDCLEFLPLSENEVTIAGEKGSKVHVEVMNGSLTAMLRHYWGLGSKNRDNHLHHAVDAVIIGFTNASVIKAFSDFIKLQEQNRAKFYAKQIAESEYKDKKAFFEPYKNFRQMVLDKVDSIFVSKPPRKRARGALHEETFYSFDDKKLHKEYGGQKGIERALELGKIRQIGTKIVSNGTMVRVDIFRHKQNGKFYGVPIYTMDFALGILPNKAVVGGKDKEGVIKDWLEMDSRYEFCFSLFKDDLILIQKKEMEKAEFCYFKSFDIDGSRIVVSKHNNDYQKMTENENKLFTFKDKDKKSIIGGRTGIQNLKTFEKYQVSSLGEIQKAESTPRQAIALKSSPKNKKK